MSYSVNQMAIFIYFFGGWEGGGGGAGGRGGARTTMGERLLFR